MRDKGALDLGCNYRFATGANEIVGLSTKEQFDSLWVDVSEVIPKHPLIAIHISTESGIVIASIAIPVARHRAYQNQHHVWKANRCSIL